MTVWPTQKSKEGDVWLTEMACETIQCGARPADAMKPVNGLSGWNGRSAESARTGARLGDQSTDGYQG